MIRRVPRWLPLVGIVSAASACDNVSWGGFDLRLKGPSEDPPASPPETSAAEAPHPPALGLGPLLFAGVREGDSVRIQPVAELGPDGLRPLPAGAEGEDLSRRILEARLRPGQELTLFHLGSRVGTVVIAGEGQVVNTSCAPRSEVVGHLEVIPGAGEVRRFLALEKEVGSAWPAHLPEFLRDQYDQRVASLSLASEAISLAGAPWPPSLLETRQDLQVFRLQGGEPPSVIATFLFRDRLGIGSAPDDAYALMVLGDPRQEAFQLAYSWYRPVGAEGKGAPRFFSHMDWDGDGEEEILLEVFGESSHWWAALDRGPGGWALVFQDPCGAPGVGG